MSTTSSRESNSSRFKANRPVVNIQNGETPLAVELRADGMLAGSRPVRVNGRVLVGQKEKVENALVVRKPVFQPVTDACSLGVLTPAAARPAP